MIDPTGKMLGNNYRIDRILGEGGMGTVYQGYDLSLQRTVAIKLIPPHLARRADFRERFVQEARLMARLDHPGIVKVYTLGQEGGLLFLPMEFIKGGNVRQLLDKLIQEQKWIPLNEAILLVQQLCQVVEYAHQNGVLHRDIKPANLMLKPEPTDGLPYRVILIDLGLAKLAEGLGLTQEGTSMGTPAYMSPEQASGQPTDRRSDVYSLGILLYELAVGRLPFRISTLSEAARVHTQVPPPAPRSLCPELSEELERIILKSLEKDPAKRYPTAAALGTVLVGLVNLPTEIVTNARQNSVSLVTTYQESIVAPSRPASASLMTMLEKEPVAPRGSSVFDGQSIAPGTQTRLQVLEKDSTARTLPLPAGTVTIGRDSTCNIVLDDNKASRKHAQITWDGMEYYVTDLGSRNGTYLENTKLLPGMAEVWKQNQNLRIGDTWLRLIPPATGAQSVAKSSLGSRVLHTNSGDGLVEVSVPPQQLAVEAGGSVSTTISMINQGPEVDHVTLSLTGIPKNSVVNVPPTVKLMPGERKETEFTLRVPRAPESRAGRHTMTLKVASQNEPSQFVETKLNLMIAPYSQFKAELKPPRLRAGQATHLMITNQGNIQETFTVTFADDLEEIRFQPTQQKVPVAEGQSVDLEYHPQLRQTRWLGGEKNHSFNAQVSPSKGGPQTLQASLLSRALIPAWLPPILLLLCCSLIGAFIKVVPAIPGLFQRPMPTMSPQGVPTTISGLPASTTNPIIPISPSATLTLTPTQTPTLTPTNTPTLPSNPAFKIQRFCQTGEQTHYPTAQVEVPANYKIIGGGAKVNWTGAGAFLTASYPDGSQRWVAAGKDHDVSDPSSITTCALALFDPEDIWDVQIFQNTSASSHYPVAEVAVPADYTMVGGGARIDWSGAGNLLTASYPNSLNSWEAEGKDHIESSPATITVFAIGIRPKNGNTSRFPQTKQFCFDSALGPGIVSSSEAIDSQYTLLSGGAIVHWSQPNPGSMLTASYPDSEDSWSAVGKDHEVPSPSSVTVCLIGFKAFSP